MPAESLNLKPTDTYRATDTQVLRRRFIGHTVFSQYTFLWSLSSTEKQGVALVIKRRLRIVIFEVAEGTFCACFEYVETDSDPI